MRYFLIMVILTSLIMISHQRMFTDRLLISQFRRNGGWYFMDRMTFDSGISFIKFNVKMQLVHQLQRQQLSTQLAIISDQKWEQDNQMKCKSSDRLDKQKRIQVILRKNQQYQREIIYEITVDQPTTYHFVFRDCNRVITNQYLSKDAILQLSLHLKNGGLQYGSDQCFKKYLLPLQLILTIFMIYLTKNPKRYQIGEQKDLAKLFVFIALVCNFVTIICYDLGFLIYSLNGNQYGLFNVLFLFFHSITESLLTAIIILISFGWTISFSSDSDLQIFYIPLISMLAILDLSLTMMCLINEGDANKYHMYDTIPSYLLAFFRVMTLLVFITTTGLLFHKTSKNLNMAKFLISFFIVSMIYFLSLPTIMIFVGFIPSKYRKQLVFFVVQWVKNGTLGYLVTMITLKGSWYARVKSSKQSFFQSGNKLL